MTCYLCDPENPNADKEGCAECDRRFWSNPVFRLPEDVPAGPERVGDETGGGVPAATHSLINLDPGTKSGV